ncbi:hypothetical protein HDU76_006643 [Blyttiomyces sp. JEL0837]|nr:hypothetical protein HDU76_006643 [Blyttiomyces sp. JEL0837]
MNPKHKTSKSPGGKSKPDAKVATTKKSQQRYSDDNWTMTTEQTKGKCGGKNKRQGDLLISSRPQTRQKAKGKDAKPRRELGVSEVKALGEKLDDMVDASGSCQKSRPLTFDQPSDDTVEVEVIHDSKFDKLVNFSKVEVADGDILVNGSEAVNNGAKSEAEAKLRDSAVCLEEEKAVCNEENPRMFLEGLRMLIPLVCGWRCLMAVL